MLIKDIYEEEQDVPGISVIIPVYNAEKYLPQCLESILGQTYRNIEVICVDDGSTDSSKNILEEYALKDDRLLVLYQKNQYAGVARNHGMEIAKGKYLLFLDADDFFDPMLCEKAYVAAQKYEADLVLFSAKRFDEKTRDYLDSPWYLVTSMIPKKDCFSRSDFNGDILSLTFLGPWNKLFRRSFVEKHDLTFQSLHNSNDDYFIAMAISLAERITAVPEELVFHRIGLSDNLQSKKHQYPTCFIEAYEAVYDALHVAGIYQSVEKGFARRVLNDCVYHLRTMKGTEAKREICRSMMEEHFSRMGLLEYRFDNNVGKRNQKYLICMLMACEKESIYVVNDDKDKADLFPDNYDYFAACLNMAETYSKLN